MFLISILWVMVLLMVLACPMSVLSDVLCWLPTILFAIVPHVRIFHKLFHYLWPSNIVHPQAQVHEEDSLCPCWGMVTSACVPLLWWSGERPHTTPISILHSLWCAFVQLEDLPPLGPQSCHLLVLGFYICIVHWQCLSSQHWTQNIAFSAKVGECQDPYAPQGQLGNVYFTYPCSTKFWTRFFIQLAQRGGCSKDPYLPLWSCQRSMATAKRMCSQASWRKASHSGARRVAVNRLMGDQNVHGGATWTRLGLASWSNLHTMFRPWGLKRSNFNPAAFKISTAGPVTSSLDSVLERLAHPAHNSQKSQTLFLHQPSVSRADCCGTCGTLANISCR